MVNVIRGQSDKPMAAKQLAQFFENKQNDLEGNLYIGYPIIGTAQGGYQIDALLVSKQHGIIIFTLVEGTEKPNIADIQDESIRQLQANLLQHKNITIKRQLAVKLSVATYAPVWTQKPSDIPEEEYPILLNDSDLQQFIDDDEQKWSKNEYFEKLNSVIQTVTNIRKKGSRHYVKQDNSRGAKLRKLEESIANLDRNQNQAMIETVEGVQRIRGLAGSGKTIVIALKVAYLHSVHPEWKIAVTFNTRSLKGQLQNLINTFVIEKTNEEPNWDNIKIINAWGSPNNEGIYYEICYNHNIEYLAFSQAKEKYNVKDVFGKICQKAIREISTFKEYYDVILIDEAQDFSKYFLRLCYAILRKPKRLIYAYDELQSLTQNSIDSPEVIFGQDEQGNPKVNLKNLMGEPQQDIILDTCYRNSRPILSSAHALGFGIYRDEGLVQMFENANLWEDIGYSVESGDLADDQPVKLVRTNQTSPKFLEDHSPIDDLIMFKTFDNDHQQVEWLVKEIEKNLNEDELKPDDLMIIHPNPISAKRSTDKARSLLFENQINSHLAGVTTSPDRFFSEKNVVFTSIHRAKGNEAAMVYLINAQECFSGLELAKKRNILFTAMTRSKAWLRVIGYGSEMQKLEEEFLEIKKNNFALSFIYPNKEKREKLNLINKDMTPQQRAKINQHTQILEDFASSLEAGEIQKESISPELREKLKKFL